MYLVLFHSPRFISLTFVSCLCLPLPFAAPLVTLPSMPRLSIVVQTVTMHELTFTMAPQLVAPKLLASRFAVQLVITHNTFCTSTKTDCIEPASSKFLNNVVAQEETFLEIPKAKVQQASLADFLEGSLEHLELQVLIFDRTRCGSLCGVRGMLAPENCKPCCGPATSFQQAHRCP